MIAAQFTEYLYWALAIGGTAALLFWVIFLLHWYFTGRIPRSPTTPIKTQKPDAAGTALA